MSGPSTDNNPVIADDEWATVIDKDGELRMWIPKDKDLPHKAVAMIAAAIRVDQDPAFADEMIEWFKTKRN